MSKTSHGIVVEMSMRDRAIRIEKGLLIDAETVILACYLDFSCFHVANRLIRPSVPKF
jgi:hypothetical protein